MTTPPTGSPEPIYMPNTTQIPNVIFDYWMNVLGNAEFKVLLCICRKTFGWRKKVDRISKRQISELTGLSKDVVRKAVRELEVHNLIKCYESVSEWGDAEPNCYEINVLLPPQELESSGLEFKPTLVLRKANAKKSNDKPSGDVGLKTSPPSSEAKPTVGLPASPTKTNNDKTKSLKGNDRTLPLTKVNKSLDGPGPSVFQETAAPKKSNPHYKPSRKYPLKKEQQPILSWLQEQNLDTDEDTLCFWIRSYPLEKLQTAIKFMHYELDRGTKIRTRGGFVRRVLEGKISPVTDTAIANREFAKDFKEANNWNALEIHEKYVLCSKTQKEVPLNLETMLFIEQLSNLYDLSQNY